MPNLENLRKQAKQLVRWHRAGHFPVAAVISAHSPKFVGLADAEILARDFRLADAQEVIARRAGFSTWQELIQGENAMTPLSVSFEQPALVQGEPQLYVADVEASIAYFEAVLGFQKVFQYGEPPFYGQVARDGVPLNLRLVHAPVLDPDRVLSEDLLSATITVKNSKALYVELQEKGAVFHRALRTEPWGARTFTVKDLDGNLILFAE